MKRIYTLVLSALMFSLISLNASAATNVSAGNVSGNWTSAGSPYYINGDITVASGTVLNIGAGVSVEFTGAYSLTVIGQILATGTATSFVTFTTYSSNTNGWKGIRFIGTTGDTSRFTYCKFSNGKVNYTMANYYDQWGGAIYIQQFNKVVIQNCMFNNNAANFGGAIATNYASPIISNSLFCNNHANTYGGAIAFEYTSTPILVGSTIANNYSSVGGGGLDVFSCNPSIRNCIIYGNDALYGYKQLWSSNYSNMMNCVVQGGHPGTNIIDEDPKFVSPTAGPGLSYNGFGANWSLSAGSPCYNRGQIFSGIPAVPEFDLAGNVRIDIDTIDIGAYEYIASTIANGNVYTTTWSGYVLLTGDVTVKNGYTLTINPGTKIRSVGNYYIKVEGRVNAIGKSDSMITFTSLKKQGQWKGIKFYATSSTNDTSKFIFCIVKNCVNTGSSFIDQYGGAFLIYAFHKIVIANSIIYNNKAYFGGGICVYGVTGGSPKIVNNLIVFNESSYHGGGLYIYSAYCDFLNNTVSRNKTTSTSYYGGGLYINTTYTNNIINSIIWDNSSNASFKNLYVNGSVNITYSDIEGGYTGTGNINSNPLFNFIVSGYGQNVSNYELSDWTLQPTSPCIDAGGNVSSVYYTSQDLSGKTRVYNSVIDMGPYEDKSFITVCGSITSNTVWDAKKVKITCDVTVNNGVTLTIPAGTIVEFQGLYEINVQGRILALGDTNKKVLFTALNKSTGWKGIKYNYPNQANDSSKFINCIFEYAVGNTGSTFVQGGAMYVFRWSKIRIDRCIFQYNSAMTMTGNGYGGAMYISISNIGIYNSKFQYNRSSLFGGAIYLSGGDVILQNDTFYADSSEYYAGAIYINSGNNTSIRNCIFSNNYGKYYGGAMCLVNYNNVQIHDNIIVNNKSTYGGAFWTVNDVPATFNNNTIANNYASSYGGAFYCENNSDIVLKNNILYGNVAASAGNQVYLKDVASDPKFYNCVVQGGTSQFAGTGSGSNYSGVFLSCGDYNPSFRAISGGAGSGYNGLAADWSLSPTSKCINDGTKDTIGLNLPGYDIKGNKRVHNGRIDIGALESQADLVYCGLISENTIWDADTVKISCDVNIADGTTLTIEKGTVVEFQGLYKIEVQGRLLVKGTASENVIFTVNDTNYFSAYDSTKGGWHGIHFTSVNTSNDSSKIEYAVFKYAKAAGTSMPDWMGGALYIYNTSKLFIGNCLFTNNFAKYYGGAIYLESSNPVIVNCVFSNNSAYGYKYNNFYYTYGGAIYMDDSYPIIVNNTFVNNTARYGGGLYIWASSPLIRNCIFWGNRSLTGYWYYGEQISLFQGSNPSISNCDIEGGQTRITNYQSLTSYTNNLDINPQFVSSTNGTGAFVFNDFANWSLQQNSPLINKGSKNLSGLSVPSIDRAGNTRIVGDTADIGAYEVQISRYFISQQPVNKTVCVGSSVTFSVSVGIPVSYQWLKNGNLISGANNSSYTISSASLSDSGSYSCVISNTSGSMYSDTVSLTILTSPSISLQPVSTSRCVDDTVSFYISVSGSQPITYQWYNTNGIIIGAINNPLELKSLTTGSANNYYCIASNTCGSATSSAATLTIKTPPVVSSLTPTSTVCENTTVVFSVTATGTATITYQWYKNSAQINGATNATYSISPVTTSHAGNYYCKATNSCGSDSTNISVLSINTLPSITSQTSSNVSYCEGTTMTLSVTATGTPTLTYQWYKNTLPITGATNNTYTVSSVTTADAGTYYCIVSNSCGSKQCNSISVTIKTSPVITNQTSSTSRCVGQGMTFSVTASGTSPFTYQWYKDNSPITSATNQDYTINSVNTSSAGSYYCVVTNVCSSVNSNQIQLTVNQAPAITTHPSNLTVCTGQSATFSVTASGTSPLTYEWYKNSTKITGATNYFYTISSAAQGDAASYYCVVTNGCGTAQSNSASLTVNTPPNITAQYGTATICSGQSNTFSVTVSGSSPISYQWYFNNNAISNATNNQYSISAATVNNAGNYYCVASNSCGNIQSATQTLTVNSPPSITSQSSSTVRCKGQPVTFYVNASGTNPLTYEWYFKNNKISGATSSTYSINSVDTSDAGAYYCKVINSCGTDQSSIIDLTVNLAPSISSQSSSATRCVGQSMTFSVTASGTGPLTYQWYYNNSKITSATNFTYTINSVATTDAGNYYCIVTNSCGTATSSVITLTVNTAPDISSLSSSTTQCEGSSVTFNVSATGSSPLSYQWYDKNGQISGATNNFLTLSSLKTSHAGNYYVIISNSCGNKQSNNINLTVNQSPVITAASSGATKCEGQSMTFSVTATGTAPLSYQWYKDGVEVFGAKNNTYTINILNINDAGSYYCVVSNSCGNAQSLPATLNVNSKPKLTMLSASDTVCSGGNLVLNVSATGTLPITYQWFFNAQPIPNATNSFYFIPNLKQSHQGNYYCVATNSCGTDFTSPIYLTVNDPVTILSQTQDISQCEGTSAELSVSATGTGPISYQWYNSKGKISGATSSSLKFNSLSLNDGEVYYCEITNPCGTEYSNNMKLTVNKNPVVNIGNDTVFCKGSGVVLSPGYGYFCKWSDGSINPQLNVTKSGDYYVEVTDLNGCKAVSNTVHVSVLEPYNGEEICVVTNDPYTGKNLIAWERTKGKRTAYYNIYRETTAAGIYEKIGSLPFDSVSVFVDNNSNPKQRAYRYRISAVDSCNNESELSKPHKTLHLTVNAGVGGQINLIWSHYEGFPFQTYRIYRGTHPDSLKLIDSIQSNLNSYTDLNPPKSTVFYQVSAVKNDTCFPTIFRGTTTSNSGPFSQSTSNIKDYNITQSSYLDIYPKELVIDQGYGSEGAFDLFTNLTDFNVSSSQGWLNVSKDIANNLIQVRALAENTFKYSRIAYVIVSAPGVAEQVLTVYQLGTDGTTALPDEVTKGKMTVFPNPADGQATIILPATESRMETLTITDINGRIVRQMADIEGNMIEVNTAGLATGVYFVKVASENIYVEKLIVK
ncbi:MAG TPA: immunoglobulin domain-containing protein [Bacteroidia bacterium]|nr:immunoglobulin domain-containing protein [Bacteroidia bacterium]